MIGEATRGSHNISLGGKHPHQIPKFENPVDHRKWVLEHTAGAFRFFGLKQFDEGEAGHISVRDPIDPDTFWINPLGKHFNLIQVSDLVHINNKGEILPDGNQHPVNSAGFLIHRALHESRPDINAACHAHSVYGKAWSTFGKPIEMLNQDACIFYKKHVVYNQFGGVAIDGEEGERIAEALGEDSNAAILQNHGLLTVGETVDQAAYLFSLLERTCECQLLVESTNLPKNIIPDKEAEYTAFMTQDPETMFGSFQPYYDYLLKSTGGDFLR